MTEQTPGLSDIVAGPGRRLGVRQLGPGQRLAAGRLPGHRGVPGHRQGLLRPGGPDPPVPAVDDDRRPWRRPDRWTVAELQAEMHRARGLTVPPADGARADRGVSRASTPDEVIEAEAMLSGTGAGAEGGIVVPWPLLFRHRIHHRLARSERYQWWVLWTVLAGLLSVNITFTVFVVALPQVAAELHTSVSTLTWTSTGPLLAFGVAAPILGQARRPPGLPPALPVGPVRGRRQRGADRLGPDRRGAHRRPPVRRRPGGGHRGRLDGPGPPGLLPRGPGQGHGLVGPGRGGRPGARGHHRRADHPVLRVAGPVLGRAAPHGGGRRAGRGRPARRATTPPTGRRAGRAVEAATPSRADRARGRQLDWIGSLDPVGRRSPPACWRSTWPRRRGSAAPATRGTVRRQRRRRGRLRAPRAAGPPPAHPAALLPDAQFRLPARSPDLRQLLLHGWVLPLPHPHGAGLRLQRDPGRPGLHGPAAHVLGGGPHRRLRRRQGGGAALDGGRGGRPGRLDAGVHPARGRSRP